MIYLELFFTFLKVGAFTFGGGYAMLPLIQEEVKIHGWMSEQALVNFIAVSESTPGPFAINIATYVGAETGGVLGSLSATFGAVLPSFCIILLIAKCFQKFQDNRWVIGCMSGLKPAVVGLIGSAVISIGSAVFFAEGISLSVFQTVPFYSSALIFAVAALLAFKKLHPILIICLSAVLGIVAGYVFGMM